MCDSYTYNAHTTAVDAIYGGVPVVTVAGDVTQSRLAAGVLGAFGAAETLARNRDDYAELIAHLISRPAALARVRARMALGGRRGLESRPLFDTEGWFRDFEGCLFLMVDVNVHGAGASRGRGWADARAGGAQGRSFHVVRALQPSWVWPMRQL